DCGAGLMHAAYDAVKRLSYGFVNRCQAAYAQLLCGGNLEHQAGGGGVGEQAALAVADPRLGGRGAAADMQRAALAANRAGILGHAPDETELEFERGVAGTDR